MIGGHLKSICSSLEQAQCCSKLLSQCVTWQDMLKIEQCYWCQPLLALLDVAFPLGRNVVPGIFGNVPGKVSQGRWMGIIFSISAFPRVIGPFISLDLLTAMDWQTWLELIICAVLSGMTFLATYDISAHRRAGALCRFCERTK